MAQTMVYRLGPFHARAHSRTFVVFWGEITPNLIKKRHVVDKKESDLNLNDQNDDKIRLSLFHACCGTFVESGGRWYRGRRWWLLFVVYLTITIRTILNLDKKTYQCYQLERLETHLHLEPIQVGC